MTLEQRVLKQAPCVDRVNVEPAILYGLSSTEAMWVIAMSFLLCMPIAIVVIVFVSLVIGATLGLVLPLLSIYFIARQMASIKRNRPDLYWVHLVRAWMARIGIRRSRFITRNGYWDLGRSLPR